MDLSHPLASLVPSMEGVVLEVLAGTHSGLGATRIHRLGYRGSRAGVSLALDRLVAQGLVLADPTNYGYTYRLNRDHVLTGAVLAAVEARREFLRRLTQACRSLDPEPVSVALFGSVARHDSGSDSDIDLFIVVDPTLDRDAPEWVAQIVRLTQRAHAWTGNRLEPITVDADHLTSLAVAQEPLTLSLRREAVTLAGQDLQELLNSAVDTATGG